MPSSTAAQRVADTGYAKSEAIVPMRDGVRLRIVILAPHAATPLPMLLQRTPYNADGAIGLARRAKDLALDGYILVFGDIRGRFRSEGRFDMNRPPRAGSQNRRLARRTYQFDRSSTKRSIRRPAPVAS